MKETHKVTVNQKASALQPAFAGRPGSGPPYNTLNTGYLGRYLQNAKDMYWNSSKVLQTSEHHDYVAHDGYYTHKE